MITRILKTGARGADVTEWQTFLRGEDLYLFDCDGAFGPRTTAATANFQARHALDTDGVVGRQTLGRALLEGFGHAPEEEDEYPPLPGLRPLGTARRIAKFGALIVEPAPVASNPEAVKETSGWEKQNLTTKLFTIAGKAQAVTLHRLVKEPFNDLLIAWEKAGLYGKILTFDGAWVMRYQRGSRTTLSAHAWGSAFDINAKWNGLGRMPALDEGSVTALVPIANDLGWYWGGHFTRKDGMHFEYVGT